MSASRAFLWPLVSAARGPVPPSDVDPVRLDVVANEYDPARGVRRVTVRLQPGEHDTRMQLQVPHAALAGWSLTTDYRALTPLEGFDSIEVVGAPPSGWEITLVLRGQGPVVVRLGRFTTHPSAVLSRALADLPAWIAPTSWVARLSEQTL